MQFGSKSPSYLQSCPSSERGRNRREESTCPGAHSDAGRGVLLHLEAQTSPLEGGALGRSPPRLPPPRPPAPGSNMREEGQEADSQLDILDQPVWRAGHRRAERSRSLGPQWLAAPRHPLIRRQRRPQSGTFTAAGGSVPNPGPPVVKRSQAW